MRLENKVAIVTGASQGIGQAIAERFIKEGAYVLCADLKHEVHELTNRLGDRARPIVANVSVGAEVAAMITEVNQTWGRLDILCNNAGIAGTPGMLADLDEDEFDRVIAINLKSMFLTMKHALPEMVRSGGGSIINISSAAGMVGFPNLSPYCASKAGVLGLTRTAALEYGPNKIRVNAICPGSVITPLNREHITEENHDSWIARHAIKRMGEAYEVAGLATYLASDEASFLTGAAIPIDGGLTAE